MELLTVVSPPWHSVNRLMHWWIISGWFEENFWLIVAALLLRTFFDFVHPFFIDKPGVPHWWSGFCLAFDALLGVFLAVRLIRHPEGV